MASDMRRKKKGDWACVWGVQGKESAERRPKAAKFKCRAHPKIRKLDPKRARFPGKGAPIGKNEGTIFFCLGGEKGREQIGGGGLKGKKIKKATRGVYFSLRNREKGRRELPRVPTNLGKVVGGKENLEKNNPSPFSILTQKRG